MASYRKDEKSSTPIHTPGPWTSYFVKHDCLTIEPSRSTQRYEDAWDVAGPAVVLLGGPEDPTGFIRADARR